MHFKRCPPRSLGMMICLKIICRNCVFHKKGSLWINMSRFKKNIYTHIYKCFAQTYLQISGIDHFYIEKNCLKTFIYIVFLWTSGKVDFLERCVYKHIHVFIYQPLERTKNTLKNTQKRIFMRVLTEPSQRTNFWKHVFLVCFSGFFSRSARKVQNLLQSALLAM